MKLRRIDGILSRHYARLLLSMLILAAAMKFLFHFSVPRKEFSFVFFLFRQWTFVFYMRSGMRLFLHLGLHSIIYYINPRGRNVNEMLILYLLFCTGPVESIGV